MKTTKKAHGPAALRVIGELEDELAASGARAGQELCWDAADRALLDLIAAALDRGTDLAADYQLAEDAKSRMKLSAELRLTEQAIARMLKQVKTDVPQPMSITSMKAQRAARARWDKPHATG